MSTGPPGPPANASPGINPPTRQRAPPAGRGARERAAGWVDSGSHRIQDARGTSRVVDSALSAFESETDNRRRGARCGAGVSLLLVPRALHPCSRGARRLRLRRALICDAGGDRPQCGRNRAHR